MIDFGLGSVIKEFDQRIGRFPTSCLLFLIFLAIAAVCVNSIYEIVIQPALPLLMAAVEKIKGIEAPERLGMTAILGAISSAAISGFALALSARFRGKLRERELLQAERLKQRTAEVEIVTSALKDVTRQMREMRETLEKR